MKLYSIVCVVLSSINPTVNQVERSSACGSFVGDLRQLRSRSLPCQSLGRFQQDPREKKTSHPQSHCNIDKNASNLTECNCINCEWLNTIEYPPICLLFYKVFFNFTHEFYHVLSPPFLSLKISHLFPCLPGASLIHSHSAASAARSESHPQWTWPSDSFAPDLEESPQGASPNRPWQHGAVEPLPQREQRSQGICGVETEKQERKVKTQDSLRIGKHGIVMHLILAYSILWRHCHMSPIPGPASASTAEISSVPLGA